MRAVVYVDQESHRARVVGKAMAGGLRRHGIRPVLTDDRRPVVAGDVAIAYGWVNRPLFEAYRGAGGHFVYIDLGYWNRRPDGDPFGGHHKVVVDGRHGTGQFRRQRPRDRLRGAPRIRPWREDGSHILLAGLSAKAAASCGLEPLQWERETVERLRRLTERPILYRPKPSRSGVMGSLPGAALSDPRRPLDADLRDAWALVTRHGNISLDALAAGVPVHAEEGLGSVLSMPGLEHVAAPPLPEGREQLFADVSYCQWSIAEMRDGLCWAHLVADGLLA